MGHDTIGKGEPLLRGISVVRLDRVMSFRFVSGIVKLKVICERLLPSEIPKRRLTLVQTLRT